MAQEVGAEVEDVVAEEHKDLLRVLGQGLRAAVSEFLLSKPIEELG